MDDAVPNELESVSPAEFEQRFRAWIKQHAEELDATEPDDTTSVEEATAAPRRFQRLLYDAGWLRAGWPPEFGGLGGPTELRALVYDELAAAGYTLPETLPTVEVLLPALMTFAPELARRYLTGFLSGDELWCQGFSETEAGSDMAAMRTRATAADGGWRVSGHKVWNSYASVSARCVLLARTGEASQRHRTISMFLVDMDTPGVDVRPIRTMTGRNELSEIYFDDVFVPGERLIGEVNGGWRAAMFLLQWERGMYAWIRQAWLHNRLDRLRPLVRGTDLMRDLGAAYLRTASLRLVTRRTLRRLARGENPGPEISVDKLLLSSAEQTVLDLARTVLRGQFELAEDRHWTGDYLYTRSASIYGGAAEIQRDIIAQRVVGLPRGR
ncbi:MAG TPA: acyl-CoA dehydrogenase family protein [Amycolatopsis sp.]|nr:acyl-CoA dehydrogenase family protein [Amycolatopsis sp.]